MKKIGLVIQGPLLSIGKSGEQYFWSLDELEKRGGPVHYDCRPNINRLISEFGHLFDEIVVSTWENEVKPGETFPGAKIVASPDPGGIKLSKHHYKDNNKFRQFLSTLNGLLELEKSGVVYAVKARTDTYLDLGKLVESFSAGLEKNDDPKLIYSTVVHGPTLLLHDLYFASKIGTMIDFAKAVLAYDRFEFISSAHMEMVLKHAYGMYKGEVSVPDWAYFPSLPLMGISKQSQKIFEYMLWNVYRSLDKDIFRDLEWRGSPFPADHVAKFVDDKNLNQRPPRAPWLVSTDWERYFHFREQETGKAITIMDRIVIKIGKLGWRLWHLARKVMKLS